MSTKETIDPESQELLKEKMFERLADRGISQPVISAMRQVPRELFVPDCEFEMIYDFKPIQLESKNPSSVSAPQVVADMIDMLELSPEDHIFELGTATGYQAAVLSHLAAQVTTVEIDESLTSIARASFEKLNIGNIDLITGDGALLSQETEQRFNKVIVTAAIYPISDNGIYNLLEEGGICVAPIGGEYGFKNLCRLTKLQKQDGEMKILDTNRHTYYSFVALGGEWGYNSISDSIAMANFMELFGESEPDYIKQREHFIAKNQEIITLETKSFVSDVEEK